MTALEILTMGVNAKTGADIWVCDETLNKLLKETEVSSKNGDLCIRFPEGEIKLSKNGHLSTKQGNFYWRVISVENAEEVVEYAKPNYKRAPIVL